MYYPRYVAIQSEDERLARYFVLQQAAYFAHKLVEVKLSQLGTTPERVMALWLIDKGYVRIPADIAKILFKENQSVAGLLNRMEAEGLAQRQKKAVGNMTFLKLTKKGKEIAGLMEKIPEWLAAITWDSLDTVRDSAASAIGYQLEDGSANLEVS